MRYESISLLILVCLAAILPSCKVQKKNINYLSADYRDTSHSRIWQNYDAKIQPGDRLMISVSALNPGSALIYNPGNSSGSASGSGTSTGGGVKVENDGNILFPQLGRIRAAGLTRIELRNVLLTELSKYLKDPTVNIEFANFKITMLGAVNRQGPIAVSDGHITLLEAIGQAGDISADGQRDSVLIIRETNGKREFGVVSMLSNETFKSPYFVLQQNDVVYVPLLRKKALISEKPEQAINFQTVTSILGIISTLGFLIINFTR